MTHSQAAARVSAAGEVRVDNDGVPMTVMHQMRLRHASDTVVGMGVIFGGDIMGHWNVDRINRILDAMTAPVRDLVIPKDNMRAMARVGAPDMAKAGRYMARGAASMPPLTFVAIGAAGGRVTNDSIMLVDGHHRMMALFMLGARSVPARVLPAELEQDVRVLEVAEVAIFPDPQALPHSVRVGESRQ